MKRKTNKGLKSVPAPKSDIPVPPIPPARSQEIIQSEYNACAAHVGDKNYRIELLKQDANNLYQQMLNLNNELAELQKKVSAK